MEKFRTLESAIEFYQLVENLKMAPHLKEQFLRSSSSVSLNLAEGNAKFSYREKKRFYQIAMGSLRESQTILRLAKIQTPEILNAADKVGASLYNLMKATEAKIPKS